ncbi:PfkB family carbohydrate kinase [Paenarthrobacter sp. A20]|uniref:sugar kinase n=1 Tax=Paenarthrobacter sp. A20 TaxID=2817891 RepID=UPI00209F37B9|nr:PfkB family carbohydrate kinase [Paenarthrobacter sp. A20]MCP1415736.1 2-dehydro-3-deoxygluconokinase [Paenarthrobacter sp. A20]
MLNSPEIVTLGECMAMLAPMEGRLGSATSLSIRAAGAESTVAQYLVDLGHSVSWISRLGSDPLGDLVLDEISRSGVDTSTVARDPEARTGVYFKDPQHTKTEVYYYRSSSAASRLGREDISSLDLERVRLAHVSGITLAISSTAADAAAVLFERVAAEGGLRSFDVNYRPGLWSVESAAPAMLEFARHSDVVLVGRDEAEELWGAQDAHSIRRLLGTGVELVVKDADIGATAYRRGHEQGVFVPAPYVDVVEPVGAGDAFAAGYLSGVLHGLPTDASLSLAHSVAGLALRSVNDHVDASSIRVLQ